MFYGAQPLVHAFAVRQKLFSAFEGPFCEALIAEAMKLVRIILLGLAVALFVNGLVQACTSCMPPFVTVLRRVAVPASHVGCYDLESGTD
jgi:hypothetical protein